MKIKQRPEDFSVVESYRFEDSPTGAHFVYRMDKQKLTTLDAVERIREEFGVKRRDISFCGLKDKQGRTEQLIAVRGKRVDLQDPDLKLTLVGRSDEPLSARNITSNRFSVIVRDLSDEEVERLPESIAEVMRTGVVNYFDSQRFGFVKHGQGFIAKDILRGDFQAALHSLIAKPSELDRSDDAQVKRWFAEHWGDWARSLPQTASKYRPLVRHLREEPNDFGGALMKLDARMRAMVVFEFQSALWNESVRRWLKTVVPGNDLVEIRYQLGSLEFPRALPPELAQRLEAMTFPLLAPDSTFEDPSIEHACLAALKKEKLTLAGLAQERLAGFHFKHEERPLVVWPGKLRASAPRADEVNRGRNKVVLSFTLPPGAYATLVVRRVLWYALPEYAEKAPLMRTRRTGDWKRPPRKRKSAEVHSADTVLEGEEAAEPREGNAALSLPVEGKSPAAERDAAERAPSPQTKREPPKGFLQKQRERKEAKALAREKAKPSTNKRK